MLHTGAYKQKRSAVDELRANGATEAVLMLGFCERRRNMNVEQIAIRQEIRQMLNEAGINKNTLKDMVKEVLQEEVSKACKQAINESDVDSAIARKINDNFGRIVREATRDEIRGRVHGIFGRMIISVDITDKDGQSVVTR